MMISGSPRHIFNEGPCQSVASCNSSLYELHKGLAKNNRFLHGLVQQTKWSALVKRGSRCQLSRSSKKNASIPPSIPPPRRTREEVIGGLVAYTGLQGTIALTISYISNLDAFGNMHWNLDDVNLGLVLAFPMLLLNCIIMLPNYTSKSSQAASSSVVNAVSSAFDAYRDPNVAEPTSEVPPSSVVEEDKKVSSSVALKEVENKDSAENIQLPKVPGGFIPAYQWGQGVMEVERGPQVNTTVKQLREALHVAQLNLANLNFSGRLSQPLEAGILSIEILAREMLFRAVLLTLLSQFISNLLIMAGTEDMLLPLGLSPVDIAPWLVLTGGLSMMSLAAGLKVVRTRRRMFQSIQKQRTKLFMTLKNEKRKKRVNAALAAPSLAPMEMLNQIPPSALKRKSEDALESSLADALAQTLDIVALSSLIMSARDVLEVAVASTAFLATGNLATSYVIALVNQLVFSTLQRQVAARQEKHIADLSKAVQRLDGYMKDIAARKGRSVVSVAPPAEPMGLPAPRSPESSPTGDSSPSSVETEVYASSSTDMVDSTVMPSTSGSTDESVHAPQMHSIEAANSTPVTALEHSEGGEAGAGVQMGGHALSTQSGVAADASIPGGGTQSASAHSNGRTLRLLDMLLGEESVAKASTSS